VEPSPQSPSTAFHGAIIFAVRRRQAAAGLLFDSRSQLRAFDAAAASVAAARCFLRDARRETRRSSMAGDVRTMPTAAVILQ